MSATLYGDCTFPSVLKTRRQLMGETPGLELVDTQIGFYKPDLSLSVYANKAAKLFDTEHAEFRPRGILLTGLPGTGKTEASKYLANKLEAPLYRLDMSGMMTKWQGESESNLKNALQVAVKSEPCVLLIDEVEKVLGSESESGGSVYRMLSQLLWWLQSHNNQIMTVMTSNDVSALPPELYRSGRIDQVLEFKGLTGKDASDFAFSVMQHYYDSTGMTLTGDSEGSFHHMTLKWAGEDMTLSQSEIIQAVKELIIECNF
jgi:AAA+ superfamily predicted ATPase